MPANAPKPLPTHLIPSAPHLLVVLHENLDDNKVSLAVSWELEGDRPSHAPRIELEDLFAAALARILHYVEPPGRVSALSFLTDVLARTTLALDVNYGGEDDGASKPIRHLPTEIAPKEAN